ncbi:MAG TPA: putative peptidoglycan glycosyltransferase FtsW [Candidatus Saccharimonadales bacterium]|nr:putative peptidoglycan glycosyltransferase FtsW [Candidatus Saccharimonadales bacterium]
MERRRALGGGRPRYESANQARRHKPDYWLLVIASLLLTIGLVVVYSISPGLSANQGISQNYFVVKQIIDVAVGVAAFWIVSLIPLDFWRRSIKGLVLAAVAGSIIVMLTPIDAVYQAHRWIRLGGFSFQVAELIKLALLIGLAEFLTARARSGQLADFKSTLRPLIILLLVIGLVVAKFQSDFGSAGVMIAMMVIMAYVAGMPLKKAAGISAIILALLALLVISTPYRRERLANYLHPESNCQTTGYQACQALISVGSGGILGLGLGHSVQAYGYTPEASNDSIFAIIAEQLGFIGTILIMVIYAVFISRLKKIAERTPDQFRRLVVVGVMAWLSVQMVINVGAMTGLLPLKGITLPLISQGGTSLVFLAAALGIVFSISRYTSYSVVESSVDINETNNPNHSIDGRRVRRPHNASLVTRPRT